MARATARSRWRAIGFVALAVGVLAAVRPWTVRPLERTAPAFDAATYVGRAWPRIVEEASRNAVDLRTARQPVTNAAGASSPTRRSVLVRVTGTLAAVDRQSRVGLARVRLAGGAGGEAAIQVGPVIRGTALRDATSFIRFNDFANQFDFAAVSNALHERVLRDVIGRLDLDSLTGTEVSVLGAASFQPGMPPDAPVEIVPIEIRPAGGTR